MARQGQSFNEYLDSYKKNASPEDLARYEAKVEHFELVNQLIERRKELNLSQVELATVTGISQPEISRIESGAANPTIDTLHRIAGGLKRRIRIQH